MHYSPFHHTHPIHSHCTLHTLPPHHAPPLPPPPQPPKDGTSYGIHVLFCPVEKRYPFIRIHTNQATTLADKRIVVAIDGWDIGSAYPHGHYVRTLGTIGDRTTETEVVLLEHDVNSAPFSAAVHACVPPLPWSVTDMDVREKGREDLRDRVVCSVDPPGCRDIDDALHVRRLENGRYELGVHIADVTHFLLPDTAMDLEASQRCVFFWGGSVLVKVCVCY